MIFAFFLALLAFFLQPLLHFEASFFCFSPWIAYVLLTSSFSRALWLSALAGTLADLFSDHPMGLHAVGYVVSAALASRFSKHLLLDNPFHLPLYSSGISFLFTCLQVLLLFLFDRRVPFTGKWIFCDLLGMPILDGIYAFIWFTGPLLAAETLHRYWKIFWLKRKAT